MSVDIPNYRVIEKLGVGQQSSIFRARNMTNGRDYAIKIVKIAKPEDMTVVDQLRSEHTIAAAIDHPTVRKVYEVRLMRQRLRVRGALLFMEFVDGVAMSDKEFRRPIEEVIHLFLDVAKGLHAMHRAGYVHADLKPNNIMVTPEGRIKLIDLGQSAKMREAKPRIQGTIDYMAPEQVQRGILDARTDVFGLGATLHKVLTGKVIATEMNRTVTMNSQSLIGRRVDDRPDQSTESLPATVARLIADCCRENMVDRLPDMPAVIERLNLARTILTRQATPVAEVEEEYDDDDDLPPDDFSFADELFREAEGDSQEAERDSPGAE